MLIDNQNPDVTLVTTTGDRPATFALAERYMARQTYAGAAQWLVIDDGTEPTVCTLGQQHVRRERLPVEPEHTLPLQWLAALPLIRSDVVVVIEDDDWYHPEYVATCVERLKHHDLVGEGWAKYFHPRNQWYKSHNNSAHASLAATAWRHSAVSEVFERGCNANAGPCVDSWIWQNYAGRKRVYEWRNLVVQLKGGPGRKGTLPSHHDPRHYVNDHEDVTLKSYVGSDYDEIVRVFRTQNQ